MATFSVGGFGKVYLIRHRHTREYCAAKHQKWASGETPRQARREVAILARLENCNNIVRFIDYFEGEEQSVILTEYLQVGFAYSNTLLQYRYLEGQSSLEYVWNSCYDVYQNSSCY